MFLSRLQKFTLRTNLFLPSRSQFIDNHSRKISSVVSKPKQRASCFIHHNFKFQSSLILPRLQYSTNSMATTASNNDKNSNIVWVDLEMSGLDINKEVILEMACIVTDKNLNVLVESEEIVIHQADKILDNMNEWCKEHHGQSGLTARVKTSTITTEMCEEMMLKLIAPYTNKKSCVLAGNSVHVDRQFLAKYMPKFIDHLHYRIIDVSTIKELCKRWYPEQFGRSPAKKESHRALDDIRESIAELKYYQQHIFRHE